MQPAVEIVVAVRDYYGRLLRRVSFHGLKASGRPVSQAEASPQQAESLAAGVRPVQTNITISNFFKEGLKQFEVP